MIVKLSPLFVSGAALLLSGCVGGLLGGGKPDQLYRFGSPAVSTSTATTKAAYTLAMRAVTFPPEISGDRLLTSQGRAMSYLKDARWVTSTPALYQSAVDDAMLSRAGVTLLYRSQGRSTDGALQIMIDRFEAVYGADPTAPPVVRVQGRASLSLAGATVPTGYRIYGEERAARNTADAMAAAFDNAVSQSTTGLANWVFTSLSSRPHGPGTPAGPR